MIVFEIEGKINQHITKRYCWVFEQENFLKLSTEWRTTSAISKTSQFKRIPETTYRKQVNFQTTSQNVNIWLIGHIESLNFNSAVFIGSQIEKGNIFLYNYIQFNPVVVILITHRTAQYNSVNLIQTSDEKSLSLEINWRIKIPKNPTCFLLVSLPFSYRKQEILIWTKISFPY
jgi:hypothetical protein